MPAAVSHTILAGNHPCIEQQEIDLPAALDDLGERRLNARRHVQLQLQRRKDLGLRLSRELSGRLLHSRQTAPGDDDLAVAFGGEQAGGLTTQPRGGASDERD